MRETNPFESDYAEYDAWFDRYPNVYESELLAIRVVLPPPGEWIEIGVGSGRFASRLGIPIGIEPAEGIATLARQRGIEVIRGKAEALPLEEASVDAAFLITTLCFVDDIDRTFREVARVLRIGGHAIVAHIPRESRFGELYSGAPSKDRFFSRATLHTTRETCDAIEAAGLRIEQTMQTLTGSPDRANDRIEPPSAGHADGSFVVVRAVKG